MPTIGRADAFKLIRRGNGCYVVIQGMPVAPASVGWVLAYTVAWATITRHPKLRATALWRWAIVDAEANLN